MDATTAVGASVQSSVLPVGSMPRAGVAAKRSASAGVLDLEVGRPVTGREAPDVGPVVPAPTRVGDGVGLLRVDGSPTVFEVVQAPLLHVRVPDVAEIGPHMRVLVTEQRREGQMLLAEHRGPLLVVGAGPRAPRVGAHRKRRRAERQQVHQHGLVVAAPVVSEEAVLGRPAQRDGAAPWAGPTASPRADRWCRPARESRPPRGPRRRNRTDRTARRRAGWRYRRSTARCPRTARRSSYPRSGRRTRVPAMPRASALCGAAARNRRVASTRCRACGRVTYPRSTPTGYVVSPKPTAAMLENDGVG